MATGNLEKPLTVGHVLAHLMPSCLKGGRHRRFPTWAADAFVLAACILKYSGAYTQVVTAWPPKTKTKNKTWRAEVLDVGTAWRSLDPDGGTWPSRVNKWWDRVLEKRDLALADVLADLDLVTALVSIVAAADHASSDFGVVLKGESSNKYELRANVNLLRNKSLCSQVHPSRAVALPKFHNPTEGMSIRSLTHNLALWDKREVTAAWEVTQILSAREELNVLALPWPLKVKPSAFRPVHDVKGLAMPEKYGLFTYAPPDLPIDLAAVDDLVAQATESVGEIDMVIFPELSMRDEDFESLRSHLDQPLLIGGIGTPATKNGFGRNKVRVGIRFHEEIRYHQQDKHHRWRIDDYQIGQYGIGCSLADKSTWWEATDIRNRTCTFFGANEWLTFCALICEDLARQDPVAELVRSVGPNLVVALLMDGPQVPERWSARYATVLAEDPRSSVLTLTCAGMVDLAISQGNSGPRSIGLWKDPKSFVRKIILERNAHGVVLCLSREKTTEWTADGRDDAGRTAYLKFDRCPPSLPKPVGEEARSDLKHSYNEHPVSRFER